MTLPVPDKFFDTFFFLDGGGGGGAMEKCNVQWYVLNAEEWLFSLWHRHTRQKESQVLLTGVKLMTFQ